MSTVTEFIRFLVRGGTAAAVAALNEIPKARELILETDTRKLKAGDGVTHCNSLLYIGELANLADPGADRIVFWDDSAGEYAYLEPGTNLSISGTQLNATGGASGGYDEGTSFPGSPTTDDKFYRTDLNLLCYYDGTRWLTVCEYTMPHTIHGTFPATNTTDFNVRWPVPSDYGIYLTRLVLTNFVATTNDASKFWVQTFARVTSANVATTLATISTVSQAASTWLRNDQAINAVLDASAYELQITIAKTSTPGTLYTLPSLLYRKIIT